MSLAAPTAVQTLLERPEALRRIGPYRLVKKLGSGAFAPVWLAEEVYGETRLRTAAVKVFALDEGGARTSHVGDTGRAQRKARILEEAQALCRVEHPNIVRFYALAVDEGSGLVGLAMEYLAGTSLRARLDLAGKLPLSETLSVGIALSSALSAIHHAGLVHRDVKPDNVIDAGGTYRLIDFGIAAAHHREPAAQARVAKQVLLDDLPLELVGSRLRDLPGAMTMREADVTAPAPGLPVSGTMGYIDPACVRGEASAPASDLYALGALLFECVTGVLPAVAATGEAGGLRGDVLDGRTPPPALASVAPDAPPALARLVDALLHPDRAARPRSAEATAVELVRIQSGISGRKRELPAEEVGPFRGLGRFESPDRDVFFGRSAEVAGAIEMLRTRGLVALVGPSGSGKSSLARAGVLPAVADRALGGAMKAWDVAVASPGADPRAAVGGALSPLVPGAAERSPLEVAVALAERAETERRGIVLLVDQLEELVTVATQGPSRAWTTSLLERLGEQPLPGVRVLVTARRDLIGELYGLGDLGRVLPRGTLPVSPMTDAVWGDVLDAALEAYGYAFEDSKLRGEVLAALSGSDTAMPLVQFALTRLWERRDRDKKRITRGGLSAIGGIEGALEQHADATVRRLTESGGVPRELVRDLLLALTTPQGTRAVRSRQELEQVSGDPDACRRALAELETARLVVREAAGLTLAHETLLSRWGMLRGWLSEAREDRLLAEEIELSAKKWLEQMRDETLLWKKRRLVAAEDLARRSNVRLSQAAVELIASGRRAERRARRFAAAIAAGVVAMIGAAVVLYVSQIGAEQAKTQLALEESKRNEVLARENERKAEENALLEKASARRARDAELQTETAKAQFEKELLDLETRVKKARTLKEYQEIQADIARRRGETVGPAATGGPTTASSTGVSTVIGDPP